MDLGPISGIRSVSLLNAQRAQREGTPNFEIDASARTGDDPNSNQQTPDRKHDRKAEPKPEEDAEFVPQSAAADEDDPAESAAVEHAPNPHEDSPGDKPENGYDWFV